jgi:hypothetical protein
MAIPRQVKNRTTVDGMSSLPSILLIGEPNQRGCTGRRSAS